MCSYYNYTKPGNNLFSYYKLLINIIIYYFYKEKKMFTSPKLVANMCCMLFNMITLTELNLHELDQNNQFVHSLIMYVSFNIILHIV